MPPAEQAAARRAAGAVDTDRKAKALSVEFLLQTHHASRLEIAAEGKQSQCHRWDGACAVARAAESGSMSGRPRRRGVETGGQPLPERAKP